MDSKLKQWLLGAALPLLPLAHGIVSLHRGSFLLSSRNGQLEIDGLAAIYLAIASIALGLALHFHFFWEESTDQSPFFSKPALIGSLLTFLFCLFRGLLLAAY